MKTCIPTIAVLLILSLFSCSNDDDTNDELIPEHIKVEIEQFIKEKESSSSHIHETFVGLDWNYSRIESSDSIIYPFAVVFRRDGRDYPLKHRCVVKADTLVDILEFNHLYKAWVSLIPVPYNVRKEDWWIELASIENVISLEFDSRRLELLDTTNNSWREVFIGNVELVTHADTLWTDTLFWNPVLDEIKAPICKIKHQKTGESSIIYGTGLTSNSKLTEWKLDNVFGQQFIDAFNGKP